MTRPVRPALLTLALALTLAPAAAQEQPALPQGPDAFEGKVVELAKHMRERTVLVYGLIGLGSGAVVTADGKVITNAHVVAGTRYPIVQWADGTSVQTRRLGIDYGRDLAVLVPEKPLPAKVPFYALAEGRPAKGTWVVACGYPGGLRTTTTPTVSLGRVTGKNPAKGGVQIMGMLDYSSAIRSDVPIFSGNSGGPLIDFSGKLVGINGAVDLEKAISMTIPMKIVNERLRTLQGDVIVLPNGTRLDPAESSLVKRLFSMLDPMMRSMPKRIREASKQAAKARKRVLPRGKGLPLETTRIPNDRLANVARKTIRQAALKTAFGTVRDALETKKGLLLTPIDANHAVMKASRLGAASEVELADGAIATVVGRSEADDLVLVKLPAPVKGVPADAPAATVGGLICVGGARRKLAYGIVSVDARPTSATVLSRIQGGSSNVGPVIKTIERLAKMFKLKSIQELLGAIRKSMEMRNAFSGGTVPRDYARVLSIDAPLPPSAVGAPVYDRKSRRVGVAIGVAHHGTSYVVPMARIRSVFKAQLRPTTGAQPTPTPTPTKPTKPAKPTPEPEGQDF